MSSDSLKINPNEDHEMKTILENTFHNPDNESFEYIPDGRKKSKERKFTTGYSPCDTGKANIKILRKAFNDVKDQLYYIELFNELTDSDSEGKDDEYSKLFDDEFSKLLNDIIDSDSEAIDYRKEFKNRKDKDKFIQEVIDSIIIDTLK